MTTDIITMLVGAAPQTLLLLAVAALWKKLSDQEKTAQAREAQIREDYVHLVERYEETLSDAVQQLTLLAERLNRKDSSQ